VQTKPVEILVIDHDTVTGLLTVDACVGVMRHTLAALARGAAFQPLRTIERPPGVPGMLGMMPGYVAAPDPVLGLKFLGIFGGNPAIGKDAHQGMVILLDPDTGEPQAILNASAITAIRTAAASAVATDVLATPDAHDLAVFGTGVQGVWHVRAIAAVRPLTRVRMTGRDAGRGVSVAAELAAELDLPVTYVPDPRGTVDGADVVVTATSATEPLFRREWLAPGVHINAVGACVPTARELDTATVVDARLFADRRESAVNEAGDFVIAAAEAGLSADHIVGEIGEVLNATVPGRITADGITVFESLGLAVEDLAAARYVVEAARRTGDGASVRF
jgi:ornithine cyclodeaminase/alanine dehydrogenase-like protein (mu-crystallin family)